jgi:hypothetical protein
MKISLAAAGAAMLTLVLLAGTAHARMDGGRGMSSSSPRISSGGMRTGSATFNTSRTFAPNSFANPVTIKGRTKSSNRMRDREEDPPMSEPEKPKGTKTGVTQQTPKDNVTPRRPWNHQPPTAGYRPKNVGGYCGVHPC